jgi:hypothetical protein
MLAFWLLARPLYASSYYAAPAVPSSFIMSIRSCKAERTASEVITFFYVLFVVDSSPALVPWLELMQNPLQLPIFEIIKKSI